MYMLATIHTPVLSNFSSSLFFMCVIQLIHTQTNLRYIQINFNSHNILTHPPDHYRAISRASNFLREYEYATGNATEEATVRGMMREVCLPMCELWLCEYFYINNILVVYFCEHGTYVRQSISLSYAKKKILCMLLCVVLLCVVLFFFHY